MMQTEWRPESLKLAQEIKRHAEKQAASPPGQFAVSWVLNSVFVSGVIAGPRTEAQWDDYIRALDYRFTAEDEALIDKLVVSGHPSTPGFNDPAYPIEGRQGADGNATELMGRKRAHQDRYGLPLSTVSAEAAAAYRDGVDLLLSAWTGAAEAFERAIAADPDFALAHIARARIHTFYQQGDVARQKAALARELVARQRQRAREEPCRDAGARDRRAICRRR